jgi:heterodisulfide reductase subunit C
MGNLYNLLTQDVRFEEALNSCMNCGICTAVCPAAEFYNYDPRKIVDTIQRRNEDEIEALLRSETIWYCGQCLSCKTRCPRGNTPAVLIAILRSVSQKMGYFTESEKGLQQFAISKKIAQTILDTGYCVHPDTMSYEQHPEQGPVWKWYTKYIEEIAPRFGANYHGEGPGALRNIRKETLEDINKIFEATGGKELMRKVETGAKNKTNIRNDEDLLNLVYNRNTSKE